MSWPETLNRNPKPQWLTAGRAAIGTEPLYPIRAVSRMTGLSVDTLRAWERRYEASCRRATIAAGSSARRRSRGSSASTGS